MALTPRETDELHRNIARLNQDRDRFETTLAEIGMIGLVVLGLLVVVLLGRMGLI